MQCFLVRGFGDDCGDVSGEPLREIALSYAVDHSTISRLKARHAAEL